MVVLLERLREELCAAMSGLREIHEHDLAHGNSQVNSFFVVNETQVESSTCSTSAWRDWPYTQTTPIPKPHEHGSNHCFHITTVHHQFQLYTPRTPQRARRYVLDTQLTASIYPAAQQFTQIVRPPNKLHLRFALVS